MIIRKTLSSYALSYNKGSLITTDQAIMKFRSNAISRFSTDNVDLIIYEKRPGSLLQRVYTRAFNIHSHDARTFMYKLRCDLSRQLNYHLFYLDKLH